MGGTRIFELEGQRSGDKAEGIGGKRKLRKRKTSSRCFGRQRPEIKRNSILTVQCFDTFRGFLHKNLCRDNGRGGLRGHIQGGPKKVSHYHESSLNRIKIRHYG